MVNKGTVVNDAAAKERGPDGELARWRTEFPEIVELGLVIYTPEGLARFLRSPQPRFGGRTALELMATGQADRVLSALAADHEGLGY